MFVLHALGFLAALSAPALARTDAGAAFPTVITDSPSATTSSSAGPATITIGVGANGHVFTPNEVTAKVGDFIKFNFYPPNHRVVRAEFGWPCIPYEYANINKAGFDSGTFTPQVVSNDPPSYTIRINDTAPLFFYCAAPNSCVPNHMIGAVNPNTTQSLDAQLAFARNATYQLAPGDKFPTESPGPTPTAGEYPGSTQGNGGGGGGNGNGDGGHDHGGLSPGAIAGIAIGGAAVVILGAVVVYLCGRRGGFDKAYRKSAVVGGAAVVGGGGGGPSSPAVVEANYANGAGMPKSPGMATLSSFGGHDGGTLRGSVFGGHGGGGAAGFYGDASPGLTTTPSPGPPPPGGLGVVPAYGFAGQLHGHQGHGHDPYASSHYQPKPEQYPQYAPAPVELPSGDAPIPAQSPPPGYQGRESWAAGHGETHGYGGRP